MEELEIKVIDACKKYVEEKNVSYVNVRYDKNGTFIRCIESGHPSKGTDEILFGAIIIKGGEIHRIDNRYDQDFKKYILKELDNKK